MKILPEHQKKICEWRDLECPYKPHCEIVIAGESQLNSHILTCTGSIFQWRIMILMTILIFLGKILKEKLEQERIAAEQKKKAEEEKRKRQVELENLEKEKKRRFEEKKSQLIKRCELVNPSHEDLIFLNVSGKIFQTSQQTLLNSDSLFKLLIEQSKFHTDQNGAIYIERDPVMMQYIINWLRKYLLFFLLLLY
jgi:hypothetical protein